MNQQASKEGDSMNEYYSAAEPSPSDAAKSGGVKKKKESSGQSGKEADKASTVKRRRAETDQVKSADDSTTMTPEGRGGCPAAGDLDAQNSAGPSPIDDSGIQTSLREEEEEEELVTGVVQSAPEEVRTKSTSSEAKTKCDVMTDVDMDEGISTSSQADDRRSSVPVVVSCMAANPASAALAPCTIMTNINNNPSQSSSPSANATTTTTSTTSTSSIPHCSSVSQHSPATSAFRQTTTTVTVGDVSTLSPPIAPTTANAEIEISRPPPPLDGPTCAAPAPAAPAQVPEAAESLVVALTGQSESHAAMAGKMDAKGAVPAANVVTEPPEPENTVALISPTNATPPPPPPSLNQVSPPPPPFTLGPEKSESAGDRSGATTTGSTATATPPPPKEGAAPSGSGSNRSESSAANAAPPASVALANRRPANTNKAAGPANAAEQRHSKILRQAEIFNSLVLTHSRNEPSTTGPKSTMTLERPKKVTIFSYKVS